MNESNKNSPEGDGAHRESKRVESQVTLSAIGEVSMAATDAVGQVAAAPRQTRWLPVFSFLFLAFIVGSVAEIYALKFPPWVQAFVAPLPLVLIAMVMFWRRQAWKFRARDWRFKEKVRHDALNSLAHETANAVNAIHANVAGFEEASTSPFADEHLRQVRQALQCLESALEKALGQVQAKCGSDSKAVSTPAKAKAA